MSVTHIDILDLLPPLYLHISKHFFLVWGKQSYQPFFDIFYKIKK